MNSSASPNQKGKHSTVKKYFEIPSEDQPNLRCYKILGLEAIDKLLKQHYGDDNTNQERQIVEKKLKQFMQEVLEAFRNNVQITSSNQQNDIKEEQIKYTEVNQELKEKVEKKKKELSSVLEKFNSKVAEQLKKGLDNLIPVLEQNFKEPSEQQNDLYSYILQIEKEKEAKQSKNNQRESQQEQQEKDKQNSNESENFVEFNMVKFMSDYIQGMKDNYIDDLNQIEKQNQVIKNQNDKILKDVKQLVHEVETIKMLQQLGEI